MDDDVVSGLGLPSVASSVVEKTYHQQYLKQSPSGPGKWSRATTPMLRRRTGRVGKSAHLAARAGSREDQRTGPTRRPGRRRPPASPRQERPRGPRSNLLDNKRIFEPGGEPGPARLSRSNVQIPRLDDYVKIGSETWQVQCVVCASRAAVTSRRLLFAEPNFNL
jgi:hypothetical protein